MNNATVKYTAVLPSDCIAELKELAEKKLIPSVNYGIRQAVERYIEQTKKDMYAHTMSEAMNDSDFISRTLETQKDFTSVDCEVGGEW